MTAPSPVLDLDDAASLEAADSHGVLRSSALGGAQVRATASAVSEDALSRLSGLRPRSLVFVAAGGRAARAAALLIAALGGRAGLPVLHLTETPPWVGPLDVVVVASEDPADPRVVESVALAARRGAEVVVAAPDEGPLQSAAAGRASVLAPRLAVLDDNVLIRYLAVGAAVLRVVDEARSSALLPNLDELADTLDAEALRDHPSSEVFHNPAKSLAARMHNRRLVLVGDSPSTAELSRHGAEILLRGAGAVVGAGNLSDALVAAAHLSRGGTAELHDYDPFFHDDQLDGPAPLGAVRTFVLSTDLDRLAAHRRIAVLADADLITADTDNPEDDGETFGASVERVGREFEQLAVLTLRLEMAAAYLQLMGGH